MNRILIIAAHPDDDILGCGGIISKYSKISKIKVIFIAEGSSCRYSYDQIDSNIVKEEIRKRNNYGIDALKFLNVTNYKFYNLQCGRLDQIPIIEINKIIEEEITNYKPDTIFTHSAKDTNNDHCIINRSTLMATRPGSKFLVNKVFTYEVLSSTEWKFSNTFKPNYFEVLSENDLNNKCNAFKKYETEIMDFPYPRSLEGIRTLSKYRGMQSGSEYAEAFELIREIKL